MASTKIIDFKEHKIRFLLLASREKVHNLLDQWLDRLEDSMEDEITLEEITNAIFSLREELLGSMTEILLSKKHQEIINQDTISCPGCGRILNSRGLRERTVETMIGKVRINRPFFYCVDCHETYYPLDEQLELSKHRKQWDIQKKETKLVTDLPYERACEHFQELTGLSFSDHAAYEIAKEIGKGLTVISVSPTREDIAFKKKILGFPSIMLKKLGFYLFRSSVISCPPYLHHLRIKVSQSLSKSLLCTKDTYS